MVERMGGRAAFRDRQSGFSLIEVLVAFTIFALVVGTALAVVSVSLRLADTSRDFTSALSVAENVLGRAGADIPLDGGAREGEVDERYAWRLTSERVAGGRNGSASELDAYRVVVEVVWVEAGRSRDVRLETVRLDPDAKAIQQRR